MLQGASGVVSLLSDRFDQELLGQLSKLRVIANYAVGYDNIDAVFAAQSGIWVTNTPDVLTEATADLTWALLLGVARRLREAEELVRSGADWQWEPGLLLGRELHGATLGILGLGRIGCAVAKRAQGFGMKVIGTSRQKKTAEELLGLEIEQVGFLELISRAEYLSIHCPLTDQTHHCIGAAEFQAMRRDAVVINTARGPVIDEAALASALEAGEISGAGLDVFEHEPQVHEALLGLSNVMLLPHVGSATRWTRRRMAEIAIQNAVSVLRGCRPSNPVVEVLNPR